MMLTFSKGRGTGGVIKQSPEDFVVKEITSKGVTLQPDTPYSHADLNEEEAPEGRFTTFVLQKRGWDTIKLLLNIAKRLRRGRRSIAYAGTKDKDSLSVQLASIYGVAPQQLLDTKLKDASINAAWKSNGVELGSNIGNAFDVIVRDAPYAWRVTHILEELDEAFPNYFGWQRFGQRLNNFAIGMHLLRGESRLAVMEFLTGTANEKNGSAIHARQRLAEEQDFAAALSYFPKHLKYETMVIRQLAKDANYANAVRALPRGLSMMFIHAVEAYIFNASVERRIAEGDMESSMHCGSNFYGFPEIEDSKGFDFQLSSIIGYETSPSHISSYEEEVMERLGIRPEDFRMRHMPELGMKGTLRAILAPIKALSCAVTGSSLKIAFSIPSGSYATVFINEITKSEEPGLRSLEGT